MDQLTTKILEKSLEAVAKSLVPRVAAAVSRSIRWAVFSQRHRSKFVRVSSSAFLRIRNDKGQYLMVRNLHRPDFFAPLGGCYKYFQGTSNEALDNFEYYPDEAYSSFLDAANDIRGFIRGKYVASFLSWLRMRPDGVESPQQCLVREIDEELFQEAQLPHPQSFVVHDLRFKHVRTYVESSVLPQTGAPQVKVFEVFDLDSHAPMSLELLKLIHENTSDRLLWTSQPEILHGRTGHGQQLIGHVATLFFSTKTCRPDLPSRRHGDATYVSRFPANAVKRPLIVVLLGLSGSGKTTLADSLLSHLVRAQLLDADIYFAPGRPFSVQGHQDTFAIYDAMRNTAKGHIAHGRDIIWCQALTMEEADPSHPPPAGRKGLIALAKELDTGLAFIWCNAPLSVLCDRLAHRARPSRSGKTWLEILERMQSTWQPISYEHLAVDTSHTVDLPRILIYLEQRRSELA